MGMLKSFQETQSAPGLSAALRESFERSLALLTAIDAGELLAALPANPEDQERHQTALSLLAMLEELLTDARDRLCPIEEDGPASRSLPGVHRQPSRNEALA